MTADTVAAMATSALERIERRQDRLERRIDEKLEDARQLTGQLLDALAPHPGGGLGPDACLEERLLRVAQVQRERLDQVGELGQQLADVLRPDSEREASDGA